MTSPFLGLRTVIYRVPDITAAKMWYTGILGFEPYFDEPFYVGYNVGGYELGLQPEETPIVHRADNMETYWGVDDIDAVFQFLIKQGATLHLAPENVGGDIWVAAVKDPWGNIFSIIKNPHFAL